MLEQTLQQKVIYLLTETNQHNDSESNDDLANT